MMTISKRIMLLQRVDSLLSMQFYVTKSDNRDAEMGCRLWSLHGMSEKDCNQFAEELNAAVQPVLQSRIAAIEKAISEHYAQAAESEKR